MPHTWAPSSARAARAASLSAAPPGRRKCVEPKLHQAKHLTHHWWLRAGSEKQTFCISCEGKGTVMTNSLEFSRQMGSLKTILPSSADGISGIWSLMLLKQTCVALESGGPECCRAYLGERFPVAPCRSPGVSVSMRALKGCRVGGGGLWWLHPCKPCHFRPLTPPSQVARILPKAHPTANPRRPVAPGATSSSVACGSGRSLTSTQGTP